MGQLQDFDVLMETRASLETALPDLESRHAELLAEVEKERARRAELDSDDKEHLNTLKEAIREQGYGVPRARMDPQLIWPTQGGPRGLQD